MKKIISIFLSALVILSVIMSAPFVFGASSFEQQLISAGFPSSYIAPLKQLHDKYPNWKFEPLFTGVNFSTAVANERTPHSQQLIQKTSSNASKGYYCTCSSCYKNGNYVIQEGSTWVSASQSAVEYYMDPANFLNEKYIFQFESTDYDSSQTVSGIETILKGTWMNNSKIVYKTSSGSTYTYTNSIYPNGPTYAQAILEAAKNSGLSAYYLASKIVQEVGGSTNSAMGASGTNSTYPGIYNYYNIGAYSGGLDGLKWAAQSSTGYFTNCAARLRASATTSSTSLVTLPQGTQVTYLSTTGTQSDGYKWYRVSVKYSGKNYTGYIRSDLVDYRKSDKYNRPWTNPYISIFNGANYIANNFSSTQNTGYLQKFNVNPASGSNMYSHEYMANVQAAASESVKTYNAYNSAGLLSMQKTFIIPVFKNMPNEISKVTGLTTAGRGDGGTKIRISWTAQANADSYNVYQIIGGKYQLIGKTTSNDFNVTGLNPSWEYYFRVAAVKDGIEYQPSNDLHTVAACAPVKDFTVTATDPNTLNLNWTAGVCHGYYIQWSTDPSFKTGVQYKNVVSSTLKNYTIGVNGNAQNYYVRIRAWRNWNGGYVYGDFTNAVQAKITSAFKVTNLSAVGRGDGGTRIRLGWDAQNGVDGYNIYQIIDGEYKLIASTTSNDYNVTKLNPSWEYYFKVSAVKDGKEGELSDELHTVAACAPIQNLDVSSNGNEINLSWDKGVCHGYYIEWSKDATFTTGVEKKNVVNSSLSSYTINVDSDAGKYYVRIRAWRNWNDGYIYGDFSETFKAYAQGVEKITGLTTAGRGDGGTRIRLGWDAQENADSYNIYQIIGGEYQLVGNSQTNSFNVTGLNPGWEYYFDVAAVKNGNDGEPSDDLHTVAACAPVKNFKVTVTDSNTINLSWTPGGACHGYYIEWSTDPTFTTGVQKKNVVSSSLKSYTIGVDGNAKNYYVRIRAWRNWNDGYIYGDFSQAVKAD